MVCLCISKIDRRLVCTLCSDRGLEGNELHHISHCTKLNSIGKINNKLDRHKHIQVIVTVYLVCNSRFILLFRRIVLEESTCACVYHKQNTYHCSSYILILLLPLLAS